MLNIGQLNHSMTNHPNSHLIKILNLAKTKASKIIYNKHIKLLLYKNTNVFTLLAIEYLHYFIMERR